MQKVMMDKLNGFIFLFNMRSYLKNIILFEIKSVLVSKKNLIVILPLKVFENQNKISWR